MAYVDYLDTRDDDLEQRQRVRQPAITSGPAGPAYPGTPQPTVRRTDTEVDYGGGKVATKTDGGWMYPWLRPQPFQDVLSDTDVTAQERYGQIRSQAAAQGLRADESDATLGSLFGKSGSVQGTMDAIAKAQQGGASRDSYNLPAVPFQFSDPYTKQLEDMARQQIGQLSQPQSNPQLEKLLDFLGKRFESLTATPGYAPEELAVLRTQMLDPIEQDRTASRNRAIQRAATAGFLPTSGITELTQSPTGGTEPLDLAFDRMRAAAQRDVAMNAITKRNQDLNQAVNIGQIAGVQIPQMQRQEDQGRRQELLALASLLYDLPARALQQAQSVVGGTEGPRDLFAQAMQQQQIAQQQRQMNEQRFAALMQAVMGLDF